MDQSSFDNAEYMGGDYFPCLFYVTDHKPFSIAWTTRSNGEGGGLLGGVKQVIKKEVGLEN